MHTTIICAIITVSTMLAYGLTTYFVPDDKRLFRWWPWSFGWMGYQVGAAMVLSQAGLPRATSIFAWVLWSAWVIMHWGRVIGEATEVTE